MIWHIRVGASEKHSYMYSDNILPTENSKLHWYHFTGCND